MTLSRIFLLVLIVTIARAQTPAFPGALGFGANATGGRGGSVYHVTTLADSGAGSFRDAVSASGRTVVFDVGGYVTLSSSVSIKNNITIAGQTAPGGGIGIKGAEVSCGSSQNIIIRHIRVRPGDASPNNDNGINLYQSTNVILDHVSIEFANWNNIDAVNCHNITIQSCIIANPTYQQFGAHTEHLDSSFSWFYTLFANGHNRQPLAKINNVFINNVIYNYQAGYTVANTSGHFSHDIINNYFITGPATSSAGNSFYQMNANQSIYSAGNLRDSNNDGVLNGSSVTPGGGGPVLSSPWAPAVTTNTPTYSAAGAYRYDVSLSGAFPRDEIDSLVISQIKTLGNGPSGTGAGTAGPVGSLYSSESQTGLGNGGFGTIAGGAAPLDSDADGMPDYWESFLGLSPNNASDRNNLIAGGWTRLEEYLNWLAQPHAITQTNTPVDVNLTQYAAGFMPSGTFTVSGASNGVVSLLNGTNAHFVPTTGFSGLASFVFTASNGGFTITNSVGIAVSSQSAPKSLRWRGDGGANNWDTSTPNWFDGASLVAFSGGDTVSIDDSGSNSSAINLPGSAAAAAFVFDATKNYTISGNGAMNGAMSLTKLGSGTLTLTTTNGFGGGVTLSEGTLSISAVTGAGSGTITFAGGSLRLNGSVQLTYPNPITVAANSTMTCAGGNNHVLGGAWTGAGTTMNVSIPSGTFTVNGNMTNFSGTIALGSSAGTFRFNSSGNSAFGSPNTTYDLGIGADTLANRNGTSIALGALTGGRGTFLSGATDSGGVASTYQIGGKNISTTFAGTIKDANATRTTAITKLGSGTLTLTGTNTFTGATTINAGTLLINGSNGTSAITVASGGTLGGSGISGGPVTVSSGGKFAPGNGVGTLNLGANLTLNTASTLNFDFANVTTVGSGVNDLISMNGGLLSLVGVTTVVPALVNGTLASGSYTLITGGGSTSGSAANLAWGGPTGGRQTFGFDTSTPGTVLLNVSGAPVNLVWRGTNGSNWDLSTTNWATGAVEDRFFNLDVAIFNDTSANGTATLVGTLQPGQVAVTNASQNFALTGAGLLGGPMQLIKSGSGSVTLDTTNTFTGSVLAGGGNVTLSNSLAAGTGAITLAGGSVSFAGVGLPSYPNAINFTASSTLVCASGNNTLAGAWTGASNITANISIPSGIFSVTGGLTNFLGTLYFGNSGGSFRINVPTGSEYAVPAATFDLGTSSATLMNRNGATITLGALAGGAGTFLSGANSVDAPSTYLVGANNASTSFSGTIKDNNPLRTTELIKIGTGTLTLTGNNTHTGGTTVRSGALRVNNPGGSGTGTNDLLIEAGATLAGNGIIGSATVVEDGATFAPGNSVGTLTFTNDLTLNDETLLQFELGTNNDSVLVNGALFLAGVLNIANAGGFGPGTYLLFAYGSTLTLGTLTLGTKPSGFVYSISTATPGQVNLIVTLPQPQFGAWSISGNALILSGSGGTALAPYRVLTTTNVALPLAHWTGTATNSFDSNGNFAFTNSVDAGPQQFFRLQLL